ncbi:MAG: hypothetical protein FWF92_03580 [Oscillospiraceae bacterium]|nr:hypothetical protein [Oscillospiraceae bacterium]
MNEIILTIFFMIAVIILIHQAIFWQIYLSKLENKWFGRILPIVSFIFSLFIFINTAFFGYDGTMTTYIYTNYNGQTISYIGSEAYKSTHIITIISDFFLFNVITLILLVIYFICRENLKKNKEIEKMAIQDL